MLIREIMTTDVQCCSKNDSAQRAAEIMKTSDIGVVPVVGEGDKPKVIGMVTDRDLCLEIVAESRNARDVKLSDFLNGRIVGCYPDEEATDVADKMAVYQVRRLPVLDDDDRLMGIVSIGDLSRERAIEADDSGEVLAAISDPPDEFRKSRSDEPRPRKRKKK